MNHNPLLALFTTPDNKVFTYRDAESSLTAHVYVRHGGWGWSVTGLVGSLANGFARRKRQAMSDAFDALCEWRRKVSQS